MCTVDEDILLNTSEVSNLDNMTAFDEDALLAGDISRRSTRESVERETAVESAPLPEQTQDEIDELDIDATIEEVEELDYDEEEDDDDEEKRERTSRYASEKRNETASLDDEHEEQDEKKKDVKVANGKKPDIPSLFDKSITNAIKSKLPPQPIAIKLKLDGGPEQVFLPQTRYQPPVYPQYNRIPPQHQHQQPPLLPNQQLNPIVPRLPNGIPLIALPSNHGTAGFGSSYNSQPPRMAGGGGFGSAPPANGQHWDQAVAMFLNKSTTTSSSHQQQQQLHQSITSRLSKRRRSGSSSLSGSSYTSESESRSRSRSGSPKHRREKRGRRGESSRRDRKRRGGYEEKKRHRDYYDERDGRRSNDSRSWSKNTTVESARALGLNNDYLSKMDEQKRKRDEILKKKEERRHGGMVSSTTSNNDRERVRERRLEPVDRRIVVVDKVQQHSHHQNLNHQQHSHQGASSSSMMGSGNGSNVENNGTERDKKKLKAYLAVNVGGVRQLPTAEKRIEQMAVELGPIKKCWRSSDDVVSIIFHSHDKAKEFMIKYNNKILSGLRILVSLEKKYLNLSEMK